MRAGIRLKLVTFITALLLVVVLIFSFIVLSGIKNYQKTENETVLLNQKNMFEQYLADKFGSYYSIENSDFQLVNGEIFNKPWLGAIPASLYSLDGNLLSGITNNKNGYSIDNEDIMLAYASKDKIAYKYVDDKLLFYSPLKYKNKSVAILKLDYSIKSSNEFYKNIQHLFLLSGIFVLIAGIITGSVYMLSFTKAIRDMKLNVQNIQRGEFRAVTELLRSDELGDLSKGIKYMSNTIENSIIELEKEKDSLKTAVEKLKEYDLKQREFFNNVTHEFKTPLTSIKAYADVMGMYDYDPEFIQEASVSISGECDRLKAMIETILNLSKIEKYEFDYYKKVVELKPFLEQICNSMLGRIKKNNLVLCCDIDDLSLETDEESIRYIFINLLDNAIKYNSIQGKISISLKMKNNQIHLQVSDTGPGIPEADISEIFEPFYTVGDDRSRSSGGSGLGLAFVKKLVEKLNGKIEVISQVGKGSDFIITFSIL